MGIKGDYICEEYFESYNMILYFQTITAGQIILGCVQEVYNYEVRVSLPHRLMGTVSLARISNAYTRLLTRVSVVCL